MSLTITPANLLDARHRAALVEILDLYARDIMGGERPLSDEVRRSLPEKLADMPNCRAFLAFDGEEGVGLLIAFLAFSTFQARPILNIHDVAVRAGRRGQGIGRKLLAAAEELARELDCCKLTLEVHVDNTVARHLYESCGFDAGTPRQEFWSKRLT